MPLAVSWPKNGLKWVWWIGMILKMTRIPRPRNTTSANTLINDIQNSLEENRFMLMMFNNKMMTVKIKLNPQTGMFGKYCCPMVERAINSEPSAIVQVNQYIHAVMKPTPGFMYLLAYVWNAPVFGSWTDNSPRQAITIQTKIEPIT